MNLSTIITKLTLTLSLTSVFFLNPPAAIRQTAGGAQVNATQTGAATTLTLDGLRARVTVRRDERGVPHIEAANEEDLYIAQGFVMASDRLWQMDLLRRSARGELSEIFGKAA
ncbi:MAG: penicillin acylase family protein, partial [Pyrinomonadaceae bacterium]|nr:penicillin acylase family protein [Pyrinomonadaceae bacterium]